MTNKVPMTADGAAALQKELDHLTKVERRRIVAAIMEARAHGDLKENAEYHAAREQQSFCEGRIKELSGKLSHAQIIDVTKIPFNGKIIFGATVTIVSLEEGGKDEEELRYRYQIVGEDEADVTQHKISVTSPIARALIGKEVDDIATVITAEREIEYEIEKIEYI